MKSTAAIALIFAAAYVAPAIAQENSVEAKIPFAFSINGSTLPAGTYVIRSDVSSMHVVWLKDSSGKAQILTLGMPGDSSRAKDHVLVFHHAGDQYFLREIRTEASTMNYTFSQSKAEKLAKSLPVEAGMRTDAPVLIALR